MENSSYTFNFKEAIKTLFSFTLVLTAISYLVGFGFKNLDSNSNIGESISSNEQLKGDYSFLFIGDSRTHQGVDSKAFSKNLGYESGNAYNLGRPGMQTPFSYFILRDYLENNEKPPEALFVQFSFYLLGGQQWMKDIYFAYYKPPLWMVLDGVSTQLVTPMSAVKWYLFPRVPLLRHRKRASDLVQIFAQEPTHKFFSMISSVTENRNNLFEETNYGYLSRGSHQINNEDILPGQYKKGIERGYSLYFKYMKRFYELALMYDFKIYVYDFPWPILQASIDPQLIPVHAYYKELIKKEAANNKNVIHIEYDFLWENEYFVDPLHLNQKGADRLTKTLSNEFMLQSDINRRSSK
jgi:hypothetical protein